MPNIPFNRVVPIGKEFEYIQQAIAAMHISGNGTFSQRCQALLEQLLDVPQVLLTTSCTHALELAALLLDVQPGDEVVLPSFTFVSTANAFVLRGARPVFIDIRPDTLNLDEGLLEQHMSPRTKVIVPVHYAGVGCEMGTIMAIARQHGVAVVEDNAHGLLGKYNDRYLGTFGCLATQSFHETKNFSCGEGGALLINDRQFIERAEILREKGTNRGRFFRGQVDKYTWVDVGSSFLPSDMLAAFLLAQLEAREQIQAKRQQIWTYYWQNLQQWAVANGIGLPTVPAHCEQSYHMFYLLMPSLADRTRLIAHLRQHGILSVFHYVPLHSSPMAEQWGYNAGDCPITQDVSERLVRLPFYNDLTEDDQAYICEAVQTTFDV